MTYSASGSAAPPPSHQSPPPPSSERGPAVVVQSTRPRPFQLARAVIWNPPASSIAGPAPSSFKTQAPATSSSSSHPHPAPLLHSVARPAAPSAPAPVTAASAHGWQSAPSHRFPPSSYDQQQQQQSFQSRPLSAAGAGAAAIASIGAIGSSGSHASFAAAAAAPTRAGSISGCEKKEEGQTGRRHASPAAPAPRSGIQERTGTSNSHPAPSGGASGARGGDSAGAASSISSVGGATAHPLQHQPLRRGKWTKAEEEFAAATIRYFCSGLLNLQFGTLLRGFLAQQLHCHPMRISKKLLPGTTFCGVEISRKLGRRAYSPRWCDSPDATQQKLDAEAHLTQLREAFIASVEEEAAAAGDDATMADAKSGESAAAAPAKSAAKARRSAPVSATADMEDEAEEKEAEDLYSRVSNVTMESATSSPHSDGMQVESRAGSPAYFQQQQPHHHRVFQQLQPQQPYLLQQHQQRHGFQQEALRPHPQQQMPYDGRKRSRDEFGAVEQDPRMYHNQQEQQQQQHAAAYSSRLGYRGAEEAHSRSFAAPLREWQAYQQTPAQQQQSRMAPRANVHYRDPSGSASSYYGGEDTIMGGNGNPPRAPYALQQSYHGAGGGSSSRSMSVGGVVKGSSPKQPKLTPPPAHGATQGSAQAGMPFHHYHIRSGYEPSYFADEEDTIMAGGAVLPRMWGQSQQPYDEHSGNARGSVGGVSGARVGGAGGEVAAPMMLPKLPSLRASLQRASTTTYLPEQPQHQQHQQRMNL